jgi:broad specificity phosphatase PhoE
MVINLFLLRHGTSTRKQIGVWGRLFDAPLDRNRVADLDRSRTILSTLHAPSIFSSPLQRCTQTLEYIFQGSVYTNIIPELRAYYSGLFEEATEADMEAHHPRYLRMTYAERFTPPMFGEESIADQTIRVLRGLRKILPLLSSPNAIISTHYSVINIIANVLTENYDLTTYAHGLFDLPEGGIIALQVEERLFNAEHMDVSDLT